MKGSLFTLSTLEYWGIAATLIAANYYSWQDELDHVDMTRILASGHTLFTYVKIIDNLKRAYIEDGDRLPLFSSTAVFSVGGAVSLAGVWLTNNPIYNFTCGVTNASCNFFSKFSTHAYRKHVDDIIFPTTTSMSEDANHVVINDDEAGFASPSTLSIQDSTSRSELLNNKIL